MGNFYHNHGLRTYCVPDIWGWLTVVHSVYYTTLGETVHLMITEIIDYNNLLTNDSKVY